MVVTAQTLLEYDDLRRLFLEGDEDERCAMVEDILRVHPPVPRLARRASKVFAIEDGDRTLMIEAGTLIFIDVEATNAVDGGVGTCPRRVDFGRLPMPLRHPSFGDGAHRCPGATIAILETVVFLNELLRVPGLRLLTTADVS